MKYWICIESDGDQGILPGCLVELEEVPDSNWGSFVWREISYEDYERAKMSDNYWNELLDRFIY